MASADKTQPPSDKAQLPYYSGQFFQGYWGFTNQIAVMKDNTIIARLLALTCGHRVYTSHGESPILTTLFMLLVSYTRETYEQALDNISQINLTPGKLHSREQGQSTSKEYQRFQARLNEIIDAAKAQDNVTCCKLVEKMAIEFLNRDDVRIALPPEPRDPLVQTLRNKKLTVITEATLDAVSPKSPSRVRVEKFLKLLPEPSSNHTGLHYDRLQLLEIWNSLSPD
jgi:hypothetical protein